MPKVNIGGRSVDYTVVKGRSRRYTYFRFGPDQKLQVIAPTSRGFNPEEAIRREASWVLREQEKARRSLQVLAGDAVMFDGRQMQISFERTSGMEEVRPDLKGATVLIRSNDPRRVKELVRRWFLRDSSAYVVRTLPKFAARLGVKYERADVREIKNWGYCTHHGGLSFSWQLIALPERLREYVLCHELAHLSEHNHSWAFKRKLALALPDFGEREKELRSIVGTDLG